MLGETFYSRYVCHITSADIIATIASQKKTKVGLRFPPKPHSWMFSAGFGGHVVVLGKPNIF